MKRVRGVFLALALLPGAALAQSEAKCSDAMDAMRNALVGVNPKNYAFSLKRQGQTYWMFFLSKPAQVAPNKTPWRLLQRQGESTDYCLIGAGDGMEPLRNMHTWNSPNRYGMPGSGYPRCSSTFSVLPGSAEVRMWANTELGESTVFALTSSIGQKNYVLLISKDGYWILLDIDRSDTNRGCYLARGDSSTVHEDFSMRQK